MNPTPMMQQYLDAKASCPGALLLFRMGDFYEIFFDDAKTAAELLGLALTSREKGDNAIPMAGFPYHQLDAYLAKLLASGLRVAVCDQVEDPKLAKGLVKREVTRVVTPGTLTDDGLLDPRESNYLASVAAGKPVGLAWIELSTGVFHAAQVPPELLADELARLRPAECLAAEDEAGLPTILPEGLVVTRRPAWAFHAHTARARLLGQFQTQTLEGFGFDESATQAVRAAGAILEYLAETQKTRLDHVERLVPYHGECTLGIDEATRRSLEITRTLRDGRRDGTLLSVIDRTSTPMGARLLADWVASPLADRQAIEARLEAVDELTRDAAFGDEVRVLLKETYDLARLAARITTARASPRDLSFVARTLALLPRLKARLTARKSGLLNQLEAEIDLCPELRGRLDAGLVDDCPLTSRDGGFIREAYSEELDALRELAKGGKQWIANYQAEEARRSGIASLKVGFNKVFGYYIEVTHAHGSRVPDHYIRKQTVKNAERYITPELKEYEERVLTADEKAVDLEHRLFVDLREAAASQAGRLLATARALARLDVLAGLADLARRQGYCRPTLVDEPALMIVEGRHPVLDATLPAGVFVPNDVQLGGEWGRVLLITGPNMAGKSTYIRQAALITLLAQMGSFVPAKSAVVGVADRLFARVGAADELARGQSTFMVEMTETARILNTATERSLVILDEVGRGTSTYDGVSLAWAVAEHLHDRVGCRTLFATHYHELVDLAQSHPHVRNLNVAVREWADEVVFLHKIIDGAADKSYGIHVARLAGVPRQVIERAKELLARLEVTHLDEEGRPRMGRRRRVKEADYRQLMLFVPQEHPLLESIRSMDLDQVAPIEALRQIRQWQEHLLQEDRPANAAPR